MEQLKHMKETLEHCVAGQISHLDKVDTKELGEAIDMIKDLSEAIYYCTITHAMEEKEEEHEPRYYGGRKRREPEDWEYYRDIDKRKGRMYYGGEYDSAVPYHGSRVRDGYTEREMPIMRDHREGKSPIKRKGYMESKEMHKDKNTQMHELELYIQELTNDIMEMIEDATPEERQMLSNKIATLSTKIK